MKKNKKTSNLKNNIGKQIIAAIILSLAFYMMINKSQAYTWIFKLMKSNLEIIKKNPELTYQQKMEAKHRFKFRFCDFIVKNTPEDAVILMPAKDIIKNVKELNVGMGSLSNKDYASYFIYPRKFLYPYDKNKNPYWDSITHVAIIDYHGYEYLNYTVNKKSRFSVLPLRK